MLIRDSLRHPSVPRVLQGVSSDSKDRNENILRTIAFPSSLPYPSISSLLLHLMKCCGKKSQFLFIPDGLSKPRLPRCRAWCGWFVSLHHLPAAPPASSPRHRLLGITSLTISPVFSCSRCQRWEGQGAETPQFFPNSFIPLPPRPSESLSLLLSRG